MLNLRKKADIVEEDWEAQYEGALEEQGLEQPIEQLSEDQKWVLADNPKTSTKILDMLAKDESTHVRLRVSLNPNTPIETLIMLSKDADPFVSSYVAKNPSTPAEISTIVQNRWKSTAEEGHPADDPEYMEEVGFPKDFKITDGYDFGASEGQLFAAELTNVDVQDTDSHPNTIVANLNKSIQLPPKPFISLKDSTPYLTNYNIVADNIDNALLPGGTVFISSVQVSVDPYIDLLTAKAKGYQLVSDVIDEPYAEPEVEEGETIANVRNRSVILTKPGQLSEEAVRLNMRKKADAEIYMSGEEEQEFPEVPGEWYVQLGSIFSGGFEEGKEFIVDEIKKVPMFFGPDSPEARRKAIVAYHKMQDLFELSGRTFKLEVLVHHISEEEGEIAGEYESDKAFQIYPNFGTPSSTLFNYLDVPEQWEMGTDPTKFVRDIPLAQSEFNLPENLPPGIASRLNMKKALEIGGETFPDTLKFKEETISPLDVETNVQELYKDAESFIINYIWSGLAAEGIISPDDANVIQTDVDKVQFSSASSLVNQLMEEGWFTYLELSYDTKLRTDPQLQQQIFNAIQNAITEGVV